MNVDVDKIAALAYLKLSPDEKTRFQSQFEKILHYVEQLNAVSMSPAEAKEMGQFHILSAFYNDNGWAFADSLRNDGGSDVSLLNLTNPEALQNAPASAGLPEGLMFEVPSIIERGE